MVNLIKHKLVLASHNDGKIREIKDLLLPLVADVLSAKELSLPEPEETGKTFQENAELKAREISQMAGLIALADDSGLVVPTLNGDPGIYSARWAEVSQGKRDFSYAINKIGKLLEYKSGVQAFMFCVLSLAFPDGTCQSFEGKIEGTLEFPPRGINGFGYDPIFKPVQYNQTFGEMDPTYKHKISHRSIAFGKFLSYLKGLESL